jgi:hypothetical protein
MVSARVVVANPRVTLSLSLYTETILNPGMVICQNRIRPDLKKKEKTNKQEIRREKAIKCYLKEEEEKRTHSHTKQQQKRAVPRILCVCISNRTCCIWTTN